LGLNVPGLSSSPTPPVNRISTDLEKLTRLGFLETIQLDRFDDFLPKVIAVGFSYKRETVPET
jgi:hypothetical protein